MFILAVSVVNGSMLYERCRLELYLVISDAVFGFLLAKNAV